MREAWQATGRQYFWYWCLQPHDPRLMNTFVEYPAIQARLLFWLASLHGVDGMMYYQTDVWATMGVQARCESLTSLSVLGYWVGARHLFQLSLFLSASRMV